MVPSVVGAVVVHLLAVLFSRELIGLEGWLFIVLDIVLWTLAMVPLIAVVRGDLYMWDPFSLTAILFFAMSCVSGIVYWLRPDAFANRLLFLSLRSDMLILCEVQLLTIIFWLIVLVVIDCPRNLGGRGRVGCRKVKREQDGIVNVKTQTDRIVGLACGAGAVVGWIGLFGSVTGYMERLITISYRGLGLGQARYALLYSISSYGALLLIPHWFRSTRRKGFWKRNVVVSLALIGTLVIGAFPLGDRTDSLMLMFAGLLLVDRFIAPVGRKGIVVAILAILVMTMGRRLGPEDIQGILYEGSAAVPSESLIDWDVLLHQDRMLNAALAVAKVHMGHGFVYGETVISGLESTYEGIRHFLLGSAVPDPRFWSMQAYTSYWHYGSPRTSVQSPTGTVGELFFNGGYVGLVLGGWMVGIVIRWIRQSFYRNTEPHRVAFLGILGLFFTYTIVTEVSVFLSRIVYVLLPIVISWYLGLVLLRGFEQAAKGLRYQRPLG